VATDILNQQSTGAIRPSRRAWAWGLVLAVAIPSVVNAAIMVRGYDGGPYLRGDCPYYYYTALALLKNHRFDLSRQLPGGWFQHANQIALSKNGRPVAKHPVVMPILSLPFIEIFGKPGALIFNVAQCTLLLVVLYLLAVRVAHPFAASAAVILTYVASFLPHYVWNYSPDLCATLLVTAGTLVVAAARRRRDWILGGVLLGLACAAKYPLVLFIAPTFLLIRRPFLPRAFELAAGMLIPLTLFALLNFHQFGSPFTTGYDRIAVLNADYVASTYSQRSSFDLPFREGFSGQLFDPEHGLLRTSPITLISLLGFPLLLWRDRRLGATLAVDSLALFLLFCFYDQWNASHYGNRFLMPVVAFGAVPLAALIQPLLGARAIRAGGIRGDLVHDDREDRGGRNREDCADHAPE